MEKHRLVKANLLDSNNLALCQRHEYHRSYLKLIKVCCLLTCFIYPYWKWNLWMPAKHVLCFSFRKLMMNQTQVYP